MSKSQKGFGRAGLSALATTTLVIGACAAFVAPANAAAGDFSAGSTPNLTVGVPNQTAGDLTYEFAGAFPTNSTIKINIADSDGNGCNTGGSNGISFATVPTITVSPVGTTAGATPTATATLQSSSPDCATVGVKDQLVISLNGGQPSAAVGEFDLNLSNVEVNVGSSASPGADVVSASENGATPASTTTNGTVVNRSFTFIPRESAQPGTTGNALGTATFTEAANNAYFGTAGHVTKVELTLSAGTFTAGVTPTISVPSGYTVTSNAAGTTAGTPPTTSSPTYTFYLKAPATASKGTVTVAGLEADAPASVQVVTIQPTLTRDADTTPQAADTLTALKALNVVQQERIGGSDRYETAANLFKELLRYDDAQSPSYRPNTVVLSGGEIFPDALSANYLAGKLGTGTLLTRANSLPDVTKNAIINAGIRTVYITGQTTAVSKAVADEIAAMHVGGQPYDANIQVVRVGGADRYATNALANEKNLQSAKQGTAILAAGTAAWDSLAAGPLAYADGYPLVLTDGSDLKHGEEGQFANLNVKRVVIVGGEDAVSAAVESQLKTDGYNVVRVAGDTRYSTAAAIAKWATVGYDANNDGDLADAGDLAAPAVPLDSDTTDIANGLEFPDALSDGPVAGAERHPLLLSAGATNVGDDLAAYLGTKQVGSASNGTTIDTLRALGLNAATANSMIDQAAADIEAK